MSGGIDIPNYTQVPNVLFEHMAEMTAAELKCTLAIVRRIIGFHKEGPEAVSYSQIQRMTGLSRQGVTDGIKACLERGYVKIDGKGKRGANLFTLNFADQSTQQTSQQGVTSQPSRPELVHSVDTQKKRKEIRKEREHAAPLVEAAESKQAPPADSPALSSEAVTDDLDLIGAWRDALPVKPLVTTYAGEASRLQELLIDDGITAADVRAYVASQYDPDTSDGFWFGKSMSFKHVAGHVREWKIGEVLKKQAVKVAPSLPPADPDCPMCEGKGVYSYDVPYGDPRFGKTEVCACRKPGTQEAAA